jgi:hypothetical protein
MDIEVLKVQGKVASLRAEGYKKLAQAEEMEVAACGGPGMGQGMGPGKGLPGILPNLLNQEEESPEEGQTVIVRIPQGVKLASLQALSSVSAELVKLGGEENAKTASEIDKIAKEIFKEAKTLENDGDESWMKKYFKAGELQGDSDEAFMKEFNTDVSAEVKEALPAGGNTEVPYQKIK